MYVSGERTVWELSRSCRRQGVYVNESKERFVLAPPMMLATARLATGLMRRIYGEQLMR